MGLGIPPSDKPKARPLARPWRKSCLKYGMTMLLVTWCYMLLRTMTYYSIQSPFWHRFIPHLFWNAICSTVALVNTPADYLRGAADNACTPAGEFGWTALLNSSGTSCLGPHQGPVCRSPITGVVRVTALQCSDGCAQFRRSGVIVISADLMIIQMWNLIVQVYREFFLEDSLYHYVSEL